MRARLTRVSPAVLILTATIVSGATGYLVTWIVAAQIDAAAYTAFAVYWSALYLVVGAFGGVQQEVTRATSARAEDKQVGARVSVFALALGAVLFCVLAATGPLWAPIAFSASSAGMLWPLAIGAASYVLVAGLCGVLYGVRLWYPLALMIVIDGVLRLLGILLALSLGGGPEALAWAVAVPFPLAIALVLPFIARRLTRQVVVDVGYRQLTWNVARTVLAAAATASLISGFPLLLRVTSPEVSDAAMAPLILALTLTRAPIVIPLMSMQSYLVVYFLDHRDTDVSRTVRAQGAIVAGSLLLAGLAAWSGPWIINALFGDGFAISPGMIFVLVASSGLVAALCVSGPAVLARSAHGIYLAGWSCAAVVTLLSLFLPLEFEGKVLLALLIGPLSGILVHAAGLWRARS